MNKPLSTYEREMKDPKFKKSFEKGYRELLFSELLISIMEDDHVSIRKLAKEADLSPSVIQDLRTGKQHDIKLSNLINIVSAFGYKIVLKKKGEQSLTFQQGKRNSRKHFNLVAAAC